ncbi:MAG: ComEC/Rec2 family competence protein [Thermoleophilaceae bacterium]
MTGAARDAAAARSHLPSRYPAHIALAALTAGLALAPVGTGAQAGPAAASLAAAAALAAVLAFVRAPRLALIAAALLLVGGAIGDARLHALEDGERRLAAAGPTAIDTRAHLLERPRPSGFGTAATVRVASGPAAGLRLYARGSADVRWPRAAGPGAELRIAGTARPLTAPREAGDGFDLAAHLRRRGVAGELSVRRVSATGGRRGGLSGILDSARGRAEGALSKGLRPREAALARGFVLGQDDAVDQLLRQDFRDSGLAHLLAVSGQNVMLLCALALPLLALAGVGIRGRVGALLALIAAYVPLAGAGPSLQRAAVMGAAGLVALAAGRASSRWYALLLAAAATLALQPRISGDPGWQLSFAAVAGIAVLAPGMRRGLLRAAEPLLPREGVARRLARPLAEGAAMTVAATTATLPLLALHFGAVPVAGVPANLAALPAVAPVMWIGMVQTALGQLGPLPLLGVAADGAARMLALPAGALLRYIAGIAEGAAAHAAPVSLELPPIGAATAYALSGCAALLAARWAGRREGGAAGRVAAALVAWRRLPRASRAGVLTAVLLAAAALAAPAAIGPRPPSALTVSFLDVGQGDATLVQHPGGGAILFDGGPPEARVVRVLRRAGVRRLDVLVATHASRDHHGGIAEVLAHMPVGLLLDGGDGSTDPAFRSLLRDAAGRGVRILPARAGLTLRAGGVTVRVLSPPPRPAGPPPEDPNPRAVVAVVSSGGFDLLLSGDAESGALLPLALPDVDAMKVPHHGSSDEGLPAVLRRARPEIVAIPVGDNGYGHPAPSTLTALRAHVPRVHRTDEDGTIRLTVDGGGAEIETER